MGKGTGAGGAIYISATTPATFDEAGYAAISDWLKIGEVSDIGSLGRTFNEVLSQPLDVRGDQKYKGGFNEGNTTLALDIDDDDTGQGLATVALNSDNDHSFRVVLPGFRNRWFQAKVMGFEVTPGNKNNMVTGQITLSRTTSATGVGLVKAAS